MNKKTPATQSKISSFVLALLFSLGSTFLVRSQVEPIYPNSAGSVSYDDTDLSNAVSKTFTISGGGCVVPLCEPGWKSVRLVLELSLADDYADITGGTGFISGSVDLTVTGDRCSFITTPDYVVSQHLEVNTDKPKQVFIIDITGEYQSVGQWIVSIDNYSVPVGYENSVVLRAGYEGDFKFTIGSGKVVIPQIVVNEDPATTSYKHFYWDVSPCGFYEKYEFQIMRLYNTDEALADLGDPQQVLCNVDWREALTVQTDSWRQNIALTLAEGTGYYVWRVRGIGNEHSGSYANPDNWGPWSSTGSNLVQGAIGVDPSLDLAQPYVLYYDQFDEDKNWSYGRSFGTGESGVNGEVKVKENIDYATGLLHKHQSQGRIASTNKILGAASSRDYSGRNAMQTLGTPVQGQASFSFKEGLALNTSGNEYGTVDFDTDGNYLNPGAVKLDGIGNAFGYYSDFNATEPTVASSADPTDPTKGYPFTRARFYKDGTSREREVSGAGYDHRMTNVLAPGEKTRTSEFFYGSVADDELLRIFGKEAPKASSVHKQISIDPNKTTWVNYVNKAGNNIARCLALNENEDGDSPLIGLESRADAIFEVNEIVNPAIPTDPFTLERIKDLILTSSTTLDLTYDLTTNAVQNICANLCRTCDYEVTVEVWDKELEQIVPGSSNTWTISPDVVCNAVVQPTQTFSVNLTPGNYQVIQRLKGNNLASPGETYLESHVDDLEEQLQLGLLGDPITGLGGVLSDVMAFIDANDLTGLYAYLSTHPQATLTSETEPDGGVSESYIFSIDLGNGPCTDVVIPVLECEDEICQVSDFIDLVNAHNNDPNSAYAIAYTYEYAPGLFHTYSQVELDALINNMLADYADASFDLCDIFGCWQNLILAYDALKDLEAQANSAPSGSGYQFNLINEFIRCVRTARYPNGDFPIIDFDSAPLSPSPIYITSAHTHFYYVLGSNVACESYATGTLGLNMADFATTWSNADQLNFYYCVTNTNPSGSTNPLTYSNAVVDACEATCEDKRLAFEQELLDLYHSQGLIVEGDVNYYIAVTMPTGAVHYVEDPLSPIPFGTPDDILQDDLDCAVDALIENCKSYCVIANPPTVTAQEEANIQHVMTSHFNITMATNNSCPPGADLITKAQLPQFIISWDHVEVDNTVHGPNFSHSLYDMDEGVGGNGVIAVLAGSRMVRLENNGSVSWIRDYTASINSQEIRSVQTIGSNYLITTDGYQVASIDAAGNVNWVQDYSGSITITGTHLTSSVEKITNGIRALWYVDNGNFHEVLVGADNSGNYQWNWTQSHAAAATLERAVLSSNDNVSVIGSLDGNTLYGVDNAGTLQWTLASYPTNFVALRDLEQSLAGNFLVGGNNSSQQFMVYEVDELGSILSAVPWQHSPGINANMYDLEATPDGGYIVTGASDVGPSRQYNVLKLSPTGTTIEWSGDFGSPRAEHTPVTVLQADGTLITGGTSGAGSGGDKTQTSGTAEWESWFLKFDYNNPECDFDPLCFEWVSITDVFANLPLGEVQDFVPLPCEEVLSGDLAASVLGQVEDYISAQTAQFEVDYHSQCIDPANIIDEFKLKYQLGYHHYTLSYYDRANNLIKTVPPQGVELQNLSDPLVQSRQVLPVHTHVTDYQYNSLGQVVRNHTPDAGENTVYRDKISRVRFNQNDHQRANDTYSYTKYDELDRRIEVGESTLDGAGQAFAAHVDDSNYPGSGTIDWIKTVYTQKASGVTYNGQNQRYLRNRISYTYTSDGSYTYYSYDPHGNVEWVIQDVPELGRNTIAYEYDFINSNILKLKYNEGEQDQYFHRFSYDSDNRLTCVETSTDGVLWDKDEKSEFYEIGSRSRSLIGQDNVQGSDLTYTIHGWLKATNHSSLDPTKDPGQDGIANTNAEDVFGAVLSYYEGDYRRAGSQFASSDLDHLSGTHDLFNGNVSAWAYQQVDATFGTPGQMLHGGDVTGFQYRYDELNRLKEGHFVTRDLTSTIQGYNATNDYAVDYRYDANGNILELNRNGHSANLDMDHLVYDYAHLDASFAKETPTALNYFDLNNRLDIVNDDDLVPIAYANDYSEDLDGLKNYTYDEIGRLTSEVDEGIASVEWNHYHKVTRIVKTDGTIISFTYDSDLHRVKKEVVDPTNINNNLTTYYVNDPDGNCLATYEKTFVGTYADFVATYKLKEQVVMGSKRLGLHLPMNIVIKEEDELGAITTPAIFDTKSELTHWGIGTQTSIFSLINIVGENRYNTDNSSFAHTFVGIGLVGDNHATLEDEDGNLILTATTARTLNGNPNVCVMRDASGFLIPSAVGIESDWRGRSIFVKQPSQDIYYYLTVNTTGELKAHKVDLTSGSPIVTPNAVTLGSGYVEGITAVEDHTGNFATQVLALRNGTGQSELVSIELTGSVPTPFSAPQVYQVYPNTSRRGDITISPDGNKIGVSNEENLVFTIGSSWFSFSITFPKTVIYNNDFNNYQTVSALTFNDLGLFQRAHTVEYSPVGTHMFYAQRGFVGTGVKRWDLAGSTIAVTGTNDEVRRGEDDEMRVIRKLNNNSNDAITVVSDPDGTPLQTSELLLINLPIGINFLRGSLPAQLHKVVQPKNELFTRCLGDKYYECTDHLGNVRVVITDRKLYDNVSYNAQVISLADYYPFGMMMPGRHLEDPTNSYRYGFQGQERDDEIRGPGNSINYAYRMHDPRIGRFFTVDPLAAEYIYNSPYAFSENRLIDGVELEGLEFSQRTDENGKPLTGAQGGYNYEGRNADGTAVEGTVPGAFYHYKNSEGQERTRVYFEVVETGVDENGDEYTTYLQWQTDLPGHESGYQMAYDYEDPQGNIYFDVYSVGDEGYDRAEKKYYDFSVDIYARAPWATYIYNNYYGLNENDPADHATLKKFATYSNKEGAISGAPSEPWCAVTVSCGLAETGYEYSVSDKYWYSSAYAPYWAVAWPESIALPLDRPVFGAITVVKSSSGSHAGMIVGMTEKTIYLLAGNQSGGEALTVQEWPKSSVQSYRIPLGYPTWDVDDLTNSSKWQYKIGKP